MSNTDWLDDLIVGFARAIRSEVLELGYASPTHPVQPNFTVFKQAILSHIDKATTIPIYNCDDSMGNEFQAGYNDMAEATRILLLQIRSELGIEL